MNYYSQHGEDFVLDQIFPGRTNGFFVEVGCIDGRRFSNTLGFEEKGWRGLCIEAHAGYIELIRKNRPGSVVCHCAAAEKDDDDGVFFANSRGTLSTLDPEKEAEFRRDHGAYFTGFERQPVPKRRLDTIFAENRVANIDFVSLDIEGYELPALRGMEFRKFRPAVMLIEADDGESAITDLLQPHGYSVICRVGNNMIYALDAGLKGRLDNRLLGEVDLIHTAHPLDAVEDKKVRCRVDTRKPRRKGASLLARLFRR